MSAAPLEWKALWDAMKAEPTKWIPTTERMYWEMLEVLPPAAHKNGAFLVGEPQTFNAQGEDIYACFREHRSLNTFEATYKTINEFNAQF